MGVGVLYERGTPVCTTSVKVPARISQQSWESDDRCGANSAHTRQSRPDSGLGFPVNVWPWLSGERTSGLGLQANGQILALAFR